MWESLCTSNETDELSLPLITPYLNIACKTVFQFYSAQASIYRSREENLQPTYPPAAHPSSLFPTIPILPIEAIPLGADQLPEGQALTPTGPSSQPIAVGNPAVPLGSLPPQGKLTVGQTFRRIDFILCILVLQWILIQNIFMT